MRFENFKRVLLSAVDEGGTGAAPDGGNEAPADAAGTDANPDDEQVILTRSQLDAMMNSQAARVRKAYERKQPPSVDEIAAKVAQDPRIARGLELVEQAERGDAFQSKVLAALDRVTVGPNGRMVPKRPTQAPPTPAAQPASAADRYFELLMAREVRAANEAEAARQAAAQKPHTYHDEINAQVSALDPEMPDHKRHAKIQELVLKQLRGVRVSPGVRTPNSTKK